VTTILADAKLGVMVSDTNMTDDDRVWHIRKVFRIRRALVATAGSVIQGEAFMEWWRKGAEAPPDFDFDDSSALVLDDHGLFYFDDSVLGLTKVSTGREAIGTGGKVALAVYEALGWKDPAKAVRITCKYDSGSRTPVRTYRLAS
jgi:hypothetical protein